MKNQESQLKSRKTVRDFLQSICAYKGKNKGLTLIEVVISLALFSLLAIPVAGFVNTSIKTNQKSAVKQQATLLGQSILEELGEAKQFNVGINENLIGESTIEVEEGDVCQGSRYCILEFEKDNKVVGINFNELNSVTQTEQVYQKEEENVGIHVDVQNKKMTVKNLTTAISKPYDINSDSNKILKLIIDENNNVWSYLGLEGMNLGVPLYGNIHVAVRNNKGYLSEVYVENKGSAEFYTCIENSNASENAHYKVKFSSSGNVKGDVVDKKEGCKFLEETLDESVSPPQPEEPDTSIPPSIIPPESVVTETVPLYEMVITILDLNNNLLFEAKRVIPINFSYEEVSK